MTTEMVERRSWEEFREIKLLWWCNRMLHLFGWAIVVSLNEDGRVAEVYPARVKFRGFDQKSEELGFIELSTYLNSISEELKDEAKS